MNNFSLDVQRTSFLRKSKTIVRAISFLFCCCLLEKKNKKHQPNMFARTCMISANTLRVAGTTTTRSGLRTLGGSLSPSLSLSTSLLSSSSPLSSSVRSLSSLSLLTQQQTLSQRNWNYGASSALSRFSSTVIRLFFFFFFFFRLVTDFPLIK